AIFSLPPEEKQLFIDILRTAGITVLFAPHEAESLCCWLNKQYGGCVLSCDTDCVAYRCPHVILKYEVATGLIQFISWKKVRYCAEYLYCECKHPSKIFVRKSQRIDCYGNPSFFFQDLA
ncbi:MAG: hypothetical protein EBV23_05355, partial [Flavobacteriia bacterium]|nr:hypothetical protein [Flavobacteriia bacterium]